MTTYNSVLGNTIRTVNTNPATNEYGISLSSYANYNTIIGNCITDCNTPIIDAGTGNVITNNI
ncbi:MAG: hypothetical protein GF383_08090 [Candidatus Lokiarchaeota archaeon]|nr:hypothetical protein [Candidatus Lokiarchaeota archaeon]